jgi:hypothetical protein
VTRAPVTSEQLDARAFHVAFEVGMLVDQIEVFVDLYGALFPMGSDTASPEAQALLEAVLVHLRLLNEFLGCRSRHPDNVRACDWPGWSANEFLSEDMREEMNAHVAHLSCRRSTEQQWDLTELGRDCCAHVLNFFNAIPPERLAAFDYAPGAAEKGLRFCMAEIAKYGTP